ncbi:HNH endonuclease [Actinobacillus genomosp. 1]|uniref:HNH endonuclease n=1 Tax=Actinobacillus genomosp. 1 TaxID=254839 RepID=UPI00244255E8|nr:HNH endonuclease [Actinobacillus genomosp. 1]WGE91939.1 HNH endonuclease [Actinobacillus genomosp. 1]
MIKLQRCEAPVYLTPEKVKELTAKFKSDKSNVWNHVEIKTSLLSFSHNKCAYCEAKLGEQSSYMEVEHFKDKKDYPDDVVNWTNLLPSCKHCNGSKSDHDVVSEPIMNPCDMLPQDHIYLHNYRILPKTEIGKMTISVLDLNNSEHLVLPRCRVGNGLINRLEGVLSSLDDYIISNQESKKRAVLRTLKAILEECQENALYSAVSATIVHGSSEYCEIFSKMRERNLWDEDFENLHNSSKMLCLCH